MFIDESLARIATGREHSFFGEDFDRLSDDIRRHYAGKSVLVIGGAGTIGAACAREILAFRPARLDIVDINENGLSHLTRAIRSDRNLTSAAKMSFNALDCGSWAMECLIRELGPWDSVLNFSAVKHVRSEKNFACVLHMFDVNVIKQARVFEMLAQAGSAADYFVVSTDKAADPSNLMGASKRLLEYLVFGRSLSKPSSRVSSARFANVAFSAGSLLESFVERLQKRVPLGCPDLTQRYFISPKEAAQICLIGQVTGEPRTMIVPRMEPEKHLVELKDVAQQFLDHHELTAVFFHDEAEAYDMLERGNDPSLYPVILTPRDTAGEKEFERFVGGDETTQELKLSSLLAVKADVPNPQTAALFLDALGAIVDGRNKPASMRDIHDFVSKCVPAFDHISSARLLDDRI